MNKPIPYKQLKFKQSIEDNVSKYLDLCEKQDNKFFEPEGDLEDDYEHLLLVLEKRREKFEKQLFLDFMHESDHLYYVASKEQRMTLAFKIMKRNVIQISSALCHPNDKWIELEGKYQAALNYDLGHYMQLKIEKYYSINELKNRLRSTFDNSYPF